MNIIIPGNPESQLRPRSTRYGNSIRLYDPKKTANYKEYVRLTAKNQCNRQFNGALVANISFYRQIPKSTSKKLRKLKNARIVRPTVKPDIDNMTKAILDSLNGIAWDDDSQVVSLIANKYYSDDPRVEIEITEVE